MDNPIIRIAVYGTLREGCSNHVLVQRACGHLLGIVPLVGIGSLRATIQSAYPYLVLGEPSSNEIIVEVYEIPAEYFGAFDTLEGYPDHYDRKEVDTPFGKAWIYHGDHEFVKKLPTIKCGDWKLFKMGME